MQSIVASGERAIASIWRLSGWPNPHPAITILIAAKYDRDLGNRLGHTHTTHSGRNVGKRIARDCCGLFCFPVFKGQVPSEHGRVRVRLLLYIYIYIVDMNLIKRGGPPDKNQQQTEAAAEQSTQVAVVVPGPCERRTGQDR